MPDRAGHDMAQIDQVSEVVGDEGKRSPRTSLPSASVPSWERGDRDQATEALIASEVRYRRLFETAQDGILILDAETGLIVDVNPFLIEMLGFSREAFVGKKIWELGCFKDTVANQDNFAELQQKEYIRYDDMPLETADGRQIDVEFVSNVYLVNDQKVIQCNIRDITERKRAEQQIASLAKYPSENPNPVLRLGQVGNIVYCNKASLPLLKIWGCSQGDTLPDPWRQWVLDALGSKRVQQADAPVARACSR